MEPIELNSGERIFSAVSSSLSSRSEAIIKKMLTGKFNKNGSVLEPFYIESSDTFFFFIKYNWLHFVLTVCTAKLERWLETKSCRILPLTYGNKYDLT